MKKTVLLFLSFLILPMVAMAADHCTDPDKYTVDKRCYVTDEQKKEKPYNAVVAIDFSSGFFCTGTIVRKNGKLWVYTAKHCTDLDNDGLSDENLTVQLQDGKQLEVTKNNVGNHDIKEDSSLEGDWAIYQLTVSDVPSVKITNKKRVGVGPLTYSYDARLVGYGLLKIMSDEEIEDFKQKYITWLKDEQGVNISWWNKEKYGVIGDGVYLDSTYAKAFQKQLEGNYFFDLFADLKLKVSNCEYSSNGKKNNCQSWGGNSGGPIFDDENAIMGIHTRGNIMIGGKNHAGSEDDWFEPYPLSIPLLR